MASAVAGGPTAAFASSAAHGGRAAPNTDTERKKAPGTQAVKVKPAVVSVWRVLQIFGVICLTIVVLTHVAETLHLWHGVGSANQHRALHIRSR
jgi:hypothetical protein